MLPFLAPDVLCQVLTCALDFLTSFSWNDTKYMWVNFVHSGIRCRYSAVMLSGCTGISLHSCLSWGFKAFRFIHMEKKSCVSEIAVEIRVLSACLECYSKNFSDSPAIEVFTVFPFLLSVLLAPSRGQVSVILVCLVTVECLCNCLLSWNFLKVWFLSFSLFCVISINW